MSGTTQFAQDEQASCVSLGSRPPGDKRRNPKSFFEVIYDPNDDKPFDYSSWNFSGNKTLSHKVFAAIQFNKTLPAGQKTVIVGIHFGNCDFEGDFTDKTPSFKNCEFDRCDFGLSKWKRAKFKDCKFYRCSFSMASFEFCEFRECQFFEISMSGNEMIITNSTFTNPELFIKSAGTNLDSDLLRMRNTNKNYQLMRLEGTKASVARAIMASHLTNGSEDDYYASVKAYQVTSINAKILLIKYELSQKPGINVAIIKLIDLLIVYLERLIIQAAGWINNWGASVARPAVIGLSIIVLFALIYWMSGLRHGLFKSLVTSADITLLIGYTKHVTLVDKSSHQLLYALNMLVGVIWYSVFIPTIIGRISRVR